MLQIDPLYQRWNHIVRGVRRWRGMVADHFPWPGYYDSLIFWMGEIAELRDLVMREDSDHYKRNNDRDPAGQQREWADIFFMGATMYDALINVDPFTMPDHMPGNIKPTNEDGSDIVSLAQIVDSMWIVGGRLLENWWHNRGRPADNQALTNLAQQLVGLFAYAIYVYEAHYHEDPQVAIRAKLDRLASKHGDPDWSPEYISDLTYTSFEE